MAETRFKNWLEQFPSDHAHILVSNRFQNSTPLSSSVGREMQKSLVPISKHLA